MYKITITRLAPNPQYQEEIADHRKRMSYGVNFIPEPKEFTVLTALECEKR